MKLSCKIALYMSVIFLLAAALSGCTKPGKLSGTTSKEAVRNENKIIKEFLSENIFTANSGGKIFCSYKIIGKNESKNIFTNYLMVSAKEYYVYENTLKSGTGVFVPVVIVLEKKTDKYEVVDFKNPLKYNANTGEAEKLFPDDILKEINSGRFSDKNTVDSLALEVKEQAKKYFKSDK